MKNNIYNVGDENLTFSKEQLVKKIAEKIEFDYLFDNFNSDLDKRNYLISFEKIHSKKFYTKISFEEGIEELIETFNVLK